MSVMEAVLYVLVGVVASAVYILVEEEPAYDDVRTSGVVGLFWPLAIAVYLMGGAGFLTVWLYERWSSRDA